MITLLLALSLFQPPRPYLPAPLNYSQMTDSELCAISRTKAQERAAHPRDYVSRTTRWRSIVVSCDDRSVNFNLRSDTSVRGSSELLRELRGVGCDPLWSPYPVMIRRGWRVVGNWTFQGGRRVSLPLSC